MLRLWEFLSCQKRSPSPSPTRQGDGVPDATSMTELVKPLNMQQLAQWLLVKSRSEGMTEAGGSSSSSSSPGRRLRSKLVISITVLSGDSLGPHDYEVETDASDLKAAIFTKWGMPPKTQKWVIGTTVVDLQSRHCSNLGAILLAAAEEYPDDLEILSNDNKIIEVSCLRVALSAEDQERLDDAMLTAAAEGDCDQIRELLRYGGDASASSQTAWPKHLRATLFSQAAGCEEATKLLQDNGCTLISMKPDSNIRGRDNNNNNNKTPTLDTRFRYRCQQKDIVELARLLHAKADPNLELRDGQGIRDTQRGTPLHAVCGFRQGAGRAALAALLCRLGADVNAPDAEGDTPLSHAKYFGQELLFDVIEKHGGSMQGPYYSTPHILGRRFLGWR